MLDEDYNSAPAHPQWQCVDDTANHVQCSRCCLLHQHRSSLKGVVLPTAAGEPFAEGLYLHRVDCQVHRGKEGACDVHASRRNSFDRDYSSRLRAAGCHAMGDQGDSSMARSLLDGPMCMPREDAHHGHHRSSIGPLRLDDLLLCGAVQAATGGRQSR